MDFTVPDEITDVCDAIRTFIDREVRPLEEAHREELNTEGITPHLYDVAKGVMAKSVAAGFYGLGMPTDIGGGGLGELGMCFVRETVAGAGVFLSMLMMGDLPFGPNRMLYELGSEHQREKYLLPLISGEKTTCIALTEPDAGSDLSGVRTHAEPTDGGWVLNGQKLFITNAPYCDFAQVFATTATGHTIFLVDKGTPGFVVGPIQRSMGDDHLQSEVFFDDCFVPDENVVGEPGHAFVYAARFLSNERIAISSTAIGMADWLVRAMVDQAQSRFQFDKPIGHNQAIQWMIADSKVELYAARSMCYDTAWHADRGDNVMDRVAMTKLYATEMVGRVADRAVQVFGGMGYMRDCPVERFYRLARVLRIAGGTSEIQRMMIARLAGLGS